MKPLGIGVVYVPSLSRFLAEAAGSVSVVELEPQTIWQVARKGGALGYRVNRERLDEVAALPCHKLLHSVGMPVGGTQPPDPVQLDLIRSMNATLGSPWISDHLSFNAFPDGDRWSGAGFFLPPRQTLEGAREAAANIRAISAALQLPVAFETGVNYLKPRGDELDDASYFNAVAAEAECGILLDLHNLWVNECNGRMRAADVIAALPLDRVIEIHVAGGMDHRGRRLDAHSGGVPDEVWALAADWLPRCPNVGAMIFEILDEHVAGLGDAGMAAQLDQMRRLWALRPSTVRLELPRVAVGPVLRSRADSFASDVPMWETTLGGLAVGRRLHGDMATSLLGDPGVELFRDLIAEARSGLVSVGLRHTMTLLMLSIGTAGVQTLLDAFAAERPPDLYASLESDAFATFLERRSLSVPYLDDVLPFEHALVRATLDGNSTTVTFSHDPTEVLTSLQRGQLPGPLEPMRTSIVISADTV